MIHKPHGVIVAGMQSSSGKTAVACMLLAALRERGIGVQPFKVGPDFIDTGYHARYAGAPSRNLDAWIMGRDRVLAEVSSNIAEKIGIAEGVMGLFDGGSATSDEGSAMELARWLDWPVLLVVPAAKTGRSLAAALRGFIAEAGEGRICGVVLNQVSGESHIGFLRDAIAPLKVPVLGAIQQCETLKWPERHLGLQASVEMQLPAVSELAAFAESSFDMDAILALLGSAPPGDRVEPVQNTAGIRVALARDAAFHFYYEANLDFLKERYEVVEFSPLHDAVLPSDVDAVIFGGGFPEVFAAQLAANSSMCASIRSSLRAGLPCYAECGGLMILTEELVTLDGRRHSMAGVIPGAVEMTPRLVNFGYCEAAKGDAAFRGHEFHHSRWRDEAVSANLWNVTKRRGGVRPRREGFSTKNLHASYVHLYWPDAEIIFDALFQDRLEHAV